MILENTSTNRVTVLRERLHLSQKEFAEKIGITQGALSQLESGKSGLSLSTITKISQAFNVDCNWLILGIEDYNDSYFDSYKKVLRSPPLIPLVNEQAHAGYISQCSDEEYVKTLDVYKIPGFEEGHYRLFEVKGDSMLPTVCPKEFVITEQVKDISTIENGLIYVVVAKDSIVVKRVYKYEGQPVSYILKSDNSDYKTYSMDSESIIEVWQVKAKISSMVEQESYMQSERFQSIENEIKQLKEQINKLLPLSK